MRALTLLHQDMQIFTIANNPEVGTLGINGPTTILSNLTVTGSITGGSSIATHLANTALSATGIRVDNAPAPTVGATLTYIGGTQALWVVPANNVPNPNVGFARTTGSDGNAGTATLPCVTLQRLYDLGYRNFDLGAGSFGGLSTSGAGDTLSFRGVGEDQTTVGTISLPAGGFLNVYCDRTVKFGNLDGYSQNLYLQGCNFDGTVLSNGTAPPPPDFSFPGNPGANAGSITMRDCKVVGSVTAIGGAGQDGSIGVNLSDHGFDGGMGGNGGAIDLLRTEVQGVIYAEGGAGGVGGEGQPGDDGMGTPGGNGGNGGNGGTAGSVNLQYVNAFVALSTNAGLGSAGGAGGLGMFGNGSPGTNGTDGNGGPVDLIFVKDAGGVTTAGSSAGTISIDQSVLAGVAWANGSAFGNTITIDNSWIGGSVSATGPTGAGGTVELRNSTVMGGDIQTFGDTAGSITARNCHFQASVLANGTNFGGNLDLHHCTWLGNIECTGGAAHGGAVLNCCHGVGPIPPFTSSLNLGGSVIQGNLYNGGNVVV